MRYAEVAVDAPVSHSRTYSYSVPQQFTVEPGQLVWVPFGRRVAQGLVVELAVSPQVEVTRDILQPIEPTPLISAVHLDLARWLSRHYLSSLFSAIAPLLPPGFEAQVRSQVFAGSCEDEGVASLRPQTGDALRVLGESAGFREQDFLKLLGRNSERELASLIRHGLVHRHAELPRPKIAPRYESYLFPVDRRGGARPWQGAGNRLPQTQRDLLRAVWEQSTVYLASQANKDFGHSVADALVRKGLLGREWVRMKPAQVSESLRDTPAEPVTLTPEQNDALTRILDVVDKPSNHAARFSFTWSHRKRKDRGIPPRHQARG